MLIQGAPALLEVQYLLALGARERQRRDALQASVGVRRLLALLAEAAAEDDPVSTARHGDVAGAISQLRYDQDGDDSDAEGGEI